MNTKKLLILGVTFLMCVQLLTAQQEYKASHYGEPGDQYLYNRLPLGFSNQVVAQDGENVIWDLSTNLNLNTHTNQEKESVSLLFLLFAP